MSANGPGDGRTERKTDPILVPAYIRPYLDRLTDELEQLRRQTTANSAAIISMRSMQAEIASLRSELLAIRAELADERLQRSRWHLPLLAAAIVVGVVIGRLWGLG